MRFAVVGCGVIGARHAQTIRDVGADLVAVVDAVPDRAAQFGSEYGATGFTSLEAALTGADFDAVAICTPSGQHADLVVAALDAGKHVLVEKPLDVTRDAVDRIAAAQQRSGKVVSVVSQRRYAPVNTLVHKAIQDGQLGRMTSATASMSWWRSQAYYDSAGWRGTWELDGGGALMNQGIHTIDVMVWMMGPAVEVSAYAEALAHQRIEVEDSLVASIRFASGALGVLHATTAAYPGLSSTLQFLGNHGSAVTINDRLEYFHAAGPDGPDEAPRGNLNQSGELTIPEATSGHRAQYEDFLEATAGKHDPLITVAEARRTLDVIWAIYDSARTGQPVKI